VEEGNYHITATGTTRALTSVVTAAVNPPATRVLNSLKVSNNLIVVNFGIVALKAGSLK
jgi:hypothetical protein